MRPPAPPPTAHEDLGALGDTLRRGVSGGATTRLHLADLLLASGRVDEAVRAYLVLADELGRGGQLPRAFGVLKRVAQLRPGLPEVDEQIRALTREQRRLIDDRAPAAQPVATVGLRPAGPPPLPELARRPLPPSAAVVDALGEVEALLATEAPRPRVQAAVRDRDDELLGLIEETLRRPTAPDEITRDTTARLLAAPLFAGLTPDEAAHLVHQLTFRTYAPGDILVTEGELGQTFSILAAGRVKVFVRSPTGRDVEVAQLDDGDFFGEVSAISGSRRTATLVAATPCETLELERAELDEIARTYPAVRDRLDAAFVERAESPVAAVVRNIDITAQGHVRSQADLALSTRFGRSHWDARMRLRLAAALVRAGHEDEAVPILAEAAGALVREGRSEAATVLLKRIESLYSRDIVEIHLAPLRRQLEVTPVEGAPARAAATEVEPGFQRWLIGLAREDLQQRSRPAPAPAAAAPHHADALQSYGPGLRASPLFETLSDDELLELTAARRLISVQPGDIVLTQGEMGESLLVLVIGAVKIWVRDDTGHNHEVCELDAGAFFGELGALSGRPRSASVTAVERTVLLEITRDALDELCARHPPIADLLDAQIRRVSP